MKTSVIEVRDLLSVLSVDEVEKRIREVPGVDSATVNYAAASATVRYDETRLVAADIKSAVRQRGYESSKPSGAPDGDDHKDHPTPVATAVSAQQEEAPLPVPPEASEIVPPASPEATQTAGQAEPEKK
jgi:Cu2+-exporting ATPase